MSDRASIALACALTDERAAVVDWLWQSGYKAVVIADVSRLDQELRAHPIEALIADLALVPSEDEVRKLARRLGRNRPLVVLGDASRLSSALLADVSAIARPLTRESLVTAVGLALAEGRPARGLPRRSVEPIPAVAHGMAVTVVAVSVGGVGLELAGPRPSVLPPRFRLRIPDFGVHVVVKRAWMAPFGVELMRCGGTIEGNVAGSTRTWPEFALEAPAPVSSVTR
jgi:hypothetical protein